MPLLNCQNCQNPKFGSSIVALPKGAVIRGSAVPSVEGRKISRAGGGQGTCPFCSNCSGGEARSNIQRAEAYSLGGIDPAGSPVANGHVVPEHGDTMGDTATKNRGENMLDNVEIVVLVLIAILFAFLIYVGKSLDDLRSEIDQKREIKIKFRKINRERKSKIDARCVKIPRQNILRPSEVKDELSVRHLLRLKYFQQFVNNKTSPKFIIEFQEFGLGSYWRSGPYKALKYEIYRADQRVGKIEVASDNDGIVVELDHPEFYDIRELNTLFFACASAHYPAGPSQSTDRLFDAAVTRSITQYLWDTHHEYMMFRINGQDTSDSATRSLVMGFNGEFSGYDHYLESATYERLNLLNVEITEIRDRARSEGYTVLEYYENESRQL